MEQAFNTKGQRNKGTKAFLLVPLFLCPFVLNALLASPAWAQSAADNLERAAALIQNNRIEEAERELNQALKVKPNDAAAFNLLGAIRAQQGKLDEAETLFARAVRADNRLVGAHLNLARLYLLKGAPEKTVAELKEALRLEPDNAEAGYRLAWMLLSLGRFDECIGFVEQAGQKSAPTLAVLGDAYSKKGAVDKAEASYLAALDADTANADALLGLAGVARIRADRKTAAQYLNRARGGVNNSPELLYKFALLALDLQLNGEAMPALKRASELRPDEPSYHFLSGVAWLRKPDLQEAELSFREFIRLRPDHAQGQMYLGYSLLKQKKYDEAREWLERSAAKDAAAPDTFYYLGLIAQEQNENERAVELFEKAIRLAPSLAHAHIALGATYLKLKNYPRAQASLETGVKLNPDDSKAHYNLALLYTRLKDPQRAQEEMRIVERLKNSSGQTAEGDAITPPSPRPR
ncbi:MAG: Beta-barrel assembly-enhancing protease [Acidobacteria bacterium]|nr:Beta-barrel assembly-enhancing protease [Acidobacteriota bacterium]